MPIFYSDTGSFNKLETSGSLSIIGSNPESFTVSGSNTELKVSDITAGANIFQITSASVDIFEINQSKEVHISGSLIITGSITGSIIGNLLVSSSASSNNISQLVFSNANNVSFGLNASTITAGIYESFSFSYFNPKDKYVQALGEWGNGSLFMQPYQAQNVQFDRVAIPVFFSKNANNASNHTFTLSMRWGVYTRDNDTLRLLTNYSTLSSIQSTHSNTNTSIYSGIRLMTIGLTGELDASQYYVAMLSNITTAGTGTISNLVASQLNSSFFGIFGQSANQTNQYTRGLGIYSTTTNNLPNSIAFSQLYGGATGTAAANSTNTLAFRSPIFYVVSQTF